MDVSPALSLASAARLRRGWRRLGFFFSVAVIVSPAILVFLWMLSLSVKNEIDNLAYPPVFIPDAPTLRNFVQVFTENSMGRYFWNSIVVSGGATLIALIVGIPAGYGIARAQAHKLTVLILAGFLGLEVISKVPTLLHTPLMSGTNAIHGIVLVGAIVVAGIPGQPFWLHVVTLAAVALGTGNVVGGFVVTDRMLQMFRRRKPTPAEPEKPE